MRLTFDCLGAQKYHRLVFCSMFTDEVVGHLHSQVPCLLLQKSCPAPCRNSINESGLGHWLQGQLVEPLASIEAYQVLASWAS